ncbi:MAG: NAD+ synthase [Deltaproteobacteria bacterium]|nr:NAD+ synthase [Deltaproteobacteria bacterium]MCL5278063.1 NAD+ synthase [Deltaproteobacteria bacterium]
MNVVRVALAQMNSHVGAVDRNAEKMMHFIADARRHKADIVVFPELALTGYPPEDLLLKPGFIKTNLNVLGDVIRSTGGISAIVGFVEFDADLYNAAAFIHDGKLIGTARKAFLPNYGVFDEYRYFQRGTSFPVYRMDGTIIGVNICEDIWYPDGPILYQALGGDAEVIININASPYHAGKQLTRERMLSTRAQDNVVTVVYVNMVGGQDELVFDGGSVIFSESGELIARARQFEEELLVADIDVDGVLRARLHDPRRREDKLTFDPDRMVREYDLGPRPKGRSPGPGIKNTVHSLCDPDEEMYRALVTGTRDYLLKNRFKKAVIGLSGGIDSSLVACIAADAVGKENVVGVFMPSMFSSKESREDASVLADNLGIEFKIIPIADVYNAYRKMLAPHFKGRKSDITEENIQARIRGNILMGLSNKFGWLVLTTGNKSEMSAGYATLYGDMAGGYAVIKDVSKMLVYKLARYRNGRTTHALIPERVFSKPPTAELRPNQKDEDSLPPYSTLDPILAMLIEEDKSVDEVISSGYSRGTVLKVQHLIDASEYKRRQSPPGVKITRKALGKDRRMPITNRYKE